MSGSVAERRARERLARVTDETATQGYEALIVSPSPDLVYLTGYAPMPLERPTLLVIRPDTHPFLVVPELERLLGTEAPGAAALELVGWPDGVDPYALTAGLLPSAGRVAVADRLWSSHLLALQHAAPHLAFASAAEVLGRVRSRKDDDELDALRRAASAADMALGDILELPFAGRREREVAADLGRLLVAHGHDRAEFTIVASGPNAASPHHEPGDRTIAEGDAVVMDFGGALDGYYSDTTRTVSVGEPSTDLREVHEVVRAAQAAACEAVRPGVAAQDVDRAARRVIEDAGLGDAFVHRTGHGIGLEVHEAPYVIEGNRSPLEAGMTFSVEPGIYLEGRFGVRIEDIVAVTEDAVERLNTSDRALRIVD